MSGRTARQRDRARRNGRQRREWNLMRLLAIGVLSTMFVACGGGMAELRQEVRELRAKVDEVSRTSAAFRSRVDGIENRLLLIQDEIETDRLAAARSGGRAQGTAQVQDESAPPKLPVVKIMPPERSRKPAAESGTDADDGDASEARDPRPVASREAAPSLGDSYQTINEQGLVVPVRPGRKGALAEPEKTPKAPRARKPAETTDDSEALSEYKAAYDLYEQGRRPEAIQAFSAFVAAHPRHPYADNAQYWVGECLYDDREYDGAKREFLKVVTGHPDGNKVPDAMVKVGLCEQMLRRYDEARRMFDTVMITYPDSPAAGVALRLLGELP